MCEYFWKHGQYCRRKHLYCHLEVAKEKEDKEAAHQILAIIQQEKIAILEGNVLCLGEAKRGSMFLGAGGAGRWDNNRV
jgi:hypothetical protein